MTDKEKEAIVKAAYPDINDTDLSWAKHLVVANDTVAEYKKRVPEAPHMLRNEILFGPGSIAKGAAAVKEIAKDGKKVFELFKAWRAKPTAEAVAATGKKGLITKKRVYGLGAAAVGVGAYNTVMSGKTAIDPNASAAEIQAQDSFAQAIANADAQGIDVTQFLQGNTATQLGLGANNIQDFMAARGFTGGLTGLNGIGIFTGVETKGTKTGPKGIVYPTSKRELVSLAEWNKSFPADLNGINAAKQKFVAAGVLDATADMTQVKAAWTKYGQMSLDYARAGNTLSPWQLLDIQKGLTGSGGSKTSVTIDESPMAKADITTLLKRQLSASLGLANIDDSVINKFISDVRKKEAKSPTRTTVTTNGTKSVRKTVQGYGQSDVLADAEAYAKTDPRYADFQTADVFGNALVKALGLKS
jgi:hypothetical protein